VDPDPTSAGTAGAAAVWGADQARGSGRRQHRPEPAKLIKQTERANGESLFACERQTSLAFVPLMSNGHDVLTVAQAGGLPADRMIGEFLGPARLVSGPGLAVVTATAPPKPRG
jgi:hypothetical protein